MLPNEDEGIEMKNIILKRNSDWSEGAVGLLGKWERICTYRKKAHYVAANSFGWKNKLLSIPIILISTVLGSMSFITPSFMEGTASSASRMLSTRELSTDAPTTLAPTPECIWERYEGVVNEESPYCDNTIIKFDNNFYKSTLSSVDELICDRSVNFVASTNYHQFSVSVDITTQSEAEAWCVERDEGHGIFYQRWVDGQIICMVLEAPPEAIILHGQHLFGGVCVRSAGAGFDEIYIKQCGDNSALLATEDIYNGDCVQPCGGSAGECPDIGGGGLGFWDCPCCYNYWAGCSFSECSNWCFPDCSPNDSSPSDSPIISSTGAPTNQPTFSPALLPTFAPTKVPTKKPTPLPTPAPSTQPSFAPTRLPTPQPSATPTITPSMANTEATTSNYTYIPYIIGAFNMIIAVLSALHAFLKYDALEDRHQQYSRHFGNLQVDLETLLAKPIGQRGSAGTAVERYKIKYAVLINNAPDLPEKLELLCCSPEDTHAIELS